MQMCWRVYVTGQSWMDFVLMTSSPSIRSEADCFTIKLIHRHSSNLFIWSHVGELTIQRLQRSQPSVTATGPQNEVNTGEMVPCCLISTYVASFSDFKSDMRVLRVKNVLSSIPVKLWSRICIFKHFLTGLWWLIKVQQEVKHRHFLGHFFCIYIQTNSTEV